MTVNLMGEVDSINNAALRLFNKNKSGLNKDLYPGEYLIDLAKDLKKKLLTTKEIMKRAVTVTESYDKFIEYAHKYTLLNKGDRKELKKLLYLTLINVNILEGIRFYVSFACSFAFVQH